MIYCKNGIHLKIIHVICISSPDQRFVVRKSPALLQEMINVGCQLTMMANSRGGTHSNPYSASRCLRFLSARNNLCTLAYSSLGFPAPRLVTIENCMKLTQMIVQGLQETKSPLLQLPHFEEEHLRYCISKKVGSNTGKEKLLKSKSWAALLFFLQ